MAKYRNRKTGEIVDIVGYSNAYGSLIDESDNTAYVDSQGVEHSKEKGNILWDFEELPETNIPPINWEERLWQLFSLIYAQRSAAAGGIFNIKTKSVFLDAKRAMEHYKVLYKNKIKENI